MVSNFESLLDVGLSRSPFQPIFRWRAARQLAVLAYHDIKDHVCFARHLDYLRQFMHPVTIDEVIAAFTHGGKLPDRAVLVTFDDGDRSVYEQAMPLMRTYGIPGIVFVVTDYLDSARPLWTEEVKGLLKNGGQLGGYVNYTPDGLVKTLKQVEDHQRLQLLDELRQTAKAPASPKAQLTSEELQILEANGIAVGSHSHTHPCLPRCTMDKIMDEITQAHQKLTACLDHAPSAFAYPNGDVDERVVNVLAQLGYAAGFLFDHNISSAKPGNRFYISRVRVNSDTPLDRFRIILSGLHPAIHRLRGKLLQ